MTPVALLDANVLYPATTRSALVYLALGGVFEARWSEAIQAEWIAALLRSRPDLDPARLERTRRSMDEHLPDASVRGYEHLIPPLVLPDPDDRHVLATAIHGGASVIVTGNLRDFPAAALAPHGVVARDPDGFVRDLLHTSPEPALAAFAADRARMLKPAVSPEEYLAMLRRAGLVETAAALEPLAERL